LTWGAPAPIQRPIELDRHEPKWCSAKQKNSSQDGFDTIDAIHDRAHVLRLRQSCFEPELLIE